MAENKENTSVEVDFDMYGPPYVPSNREVELDVNKFDDKYNTATLDQDKGIASDSPTQSSPSR